MTKMAKEANSLGLGSPAKILADEMDAAKLHLFLEEKKQQRLITGAAPGQTVVDRVASLELEDEDEAEPEDDDDEDVEGDDSFDFGDDGMVL